jgi:hypothetical protein
MLWIYAYIQTHALHLFLQLYDYSFYDIQIETRNNKLEMQSVNNVSLIEELDKLLERLQVPSEVCFSSLSCQLVTFMAMCSNFPSSNHAMMVVACSMSNRRFI